MELWRELLISGLQNESCKIDYINDDIIKDIIKSNSYKVLLEIKNILDDVKLTDRECFIIIEQIKLIKNALYKFFILLIFLLIV